MSGVQASSIAISCMSLWRPYKFTTSKEFLISAYIYDGGSRRDFRLSRCIVHFIAGPFAVIITFRLHFLDKQGSIDRFFFYFFILELKSVIPSCSTKFHYLTTNHFATENSKIELCLQNYLYAFISTMQSETETAMTQSSSRLLKLFFDDSRESVVGIVNYLYTENRSVLDFFDEISKDTGMVLKDSARTYG